MEHQCWDNAQYLRRECLEVVRIPKEIVQKDFAGKVLSVLEKVGCKIDPDNIEDCSLPAIKHVNDSEYYFPNVDLSPTSTSNSGL